ncbi:hypothetical protein PIB30_082878 [Stylosanthes scabra]|uniref:Uncharacterized protein n=1 Tax=Stylosanthes scabra TaxID=79078 RepID=A0ABU6XUE8_9FABA|nr:hypothetical protein [Stylosanthes scabra]
MVHSRGTFHTLGKSDTTGYVALEYSNLGAAVIPIWLGPSILEVPSSQRNPTVKVPLWGTVPIGVSRNCPLLLIINQLHLWTRSLHLLIPKLDPLDMLK